MLGRKCFTCHWKCIYDNGDLIGKELITDPYGKLPCCSGTGTPQQRDKIKCPV